MKSDQGASLNGLVKDPIMQRVVLDQSSQSSRLRFKHSLIV
ncbi:hypothetical protein [Paenibacillus jiagnxiensis]